MARYVAASLAELVQLLSVSWTLEFDRLFDNFDKFIVAQFVRGKANNLEVMWIETSFLLYIYENNLCKSFMNKGTHKTEECWELSKRSVPGSVMNGPPPTSFFLARSPEAPMMTRTVFSGILILGAMVAQSQNDADCQVIETRCLAGDKGER